jgi:hypothetical protein
MKGSFIVGIVLIFSLSMAGQVKAQEKVKNGEPAGISRLATEKSTEAAKSEESRGLAKAGEKKEVSAKPDHWRIGGMVIAIDPKAETLSVHQETVYHNRILKLEMSGEMAKELRNVKPGDLVNVWVTGKTVTALNKVS